MIWYLYSLSLSTPAQLISRTRINLPEPELCSEFLKPSSPTKFFFLLITPQILLTPQILQNLCHHGIQQDHMLGSSHRQAIQTKVSYHVRNRSKRPTELS